MRHIATLLALSIILPACADPQVPPLVSLDGPTNMVLARTCIESSGVRSHISNCLDEDEKPDENLGRVNEFAFVSNRLGNSLAVISFQGRVPEVIDTAPDVPGQTHIPVGRGPTLVTASRNGNFIFVYNEVDGDLSVVSEELRREVARLPLSSGEQNAPSSVVSGLFLVPDRQDETRDALWVVQPDRSSIAEIRWQFTCDDPGVYREGCEPEIVDVEVATLYEFTDGARPHYAALGPNGDLWVTFFDRAVTARLATSGDVDCTDGAAAPPCITAEIGLTFGCSDGLDNDGDGLTDATDPQCLTPNSRESIEGVGRVRLVQCNDGIDNDGDNAVDSDDAGCLGTADDSEGGGLVAVACSDGLDNDGDGAVDLQDSDCAAGPFWNDEAALPECSDGLDNDDNGLVDQDDPKCRSSLQNNEGRLPACNDGVDNDNDGLVDEDDPDCTSPTGDDEATACFDGVDNDSDGAKDLADPGCQTPTSPGEISAATECQDGVDNDGDGRTDYPADTDCFRATGRGEAQTRIREFGPIDVDPEGRYVYVVNRRTSQVLVVDATAGRLMDPNDCYGDREAADCRRRPWDDSIGLPVARLPTAIHARIIELETEELDDGRVLTRNLHAANVATTSGAVYYVEAAVISDFDGEEIVDPRVRIGDFNRSDASVTGLNCSLSPEVRDYVRASRTLTGEDIRCQETPELPHITSVAGACTPANEDDLDCLCETPDDPSTCTINADRKPPIALLTRHEVRFDDDPDATETTIERVEEDVTDDYYIANDQWTVTYEGTILSRSDAVVERSASGLIRTVSGDFCGAGLAPGDHLSIQSPITSSSDVEEGECEVFENADLVWRITDVSASYLAIEVIEEDDADAPPVPEEANFRVAVLPTHRCFAAGLLIDVRPVETWVVRGENTGLLVNARREGNACVPRLHDVEDYGFRGYLDEDFSSPWFRFRIESGELAPLRDFEMSFRTNRNFSSGSSNSLSSGPSPAQVLEFETVRGSYIPILDSGNNTILVFDAANDRFLELLF